MGAGSSHECLGLQRCNWADLILPGTPLSPRASPAHAVTSAAGDAPKRTSVQSAHTPLSFRVRLLVTLLQSAGSPAAASQRPRQGTNLSVKHWGEAPTSVTCCLSNTFFKRVFILLSALHQYFCIRDLSPKTFQGNE